MLGIHNSRADYHSVAPKASAVSGSGLLQSVMELARFHVTSSDYGPLSRVGMKETERLDIGPVF